MNRTEAREEIMKILYQMDINKSFDNEIQKNTISELNDDSVEFKYIADSINSYIDKKDQIDNIISEFLSNWTLNRIPKIDLAIIRMAINEINYTEIPISITINEAINICKKYSDSNSYKFVNGLLGSYVRKYKADK